MQSDIIDQIRDWHRKRSAAMQIRKRADLALGANLRTWLGWRKDLAEDQRELIEAKAQELIACGEKQVKGKPHALAGSAEFLDFGSFITMAIEARKPTDAFEKLSTEALETLAEQLPVWILFGAAVRGFSVRSLAVIIGQAGDLSGYASHSKFWKRMGSAPFEKDGVTRSGKQWRVRRGLSDEDWIKYGYSGRRRAQMYVIELGLIKAKGDYYGVYIARKQYLRDRALVQGKPVVPAAKIPKGRAGDFISLGEIDAQARHYMGKRLLRDLWKAWRRAERAVDNNGPRKDVPSSDNSNAPQGAGPARTAVPTKATPPMPARNRRRVAA